MPLEASLLPISNRVDDLNARYAHHGGADVLSHALDDPMVGQTALVSSFGAESVVLLHMLSVIDRTTPVLFIDTEMLFPETLDYQREVAEKLRLTNVQVIRPEREKTFLKDPNNGLHRTNPDACCDLRKTQPLEAALAPYDAWITGRKRFHGGKRETLTFFEAQGDARIQINPLAHFTRDDLAEYITNNRLPRHPLVAKGFTSLGCATCTTRVDEGEDVRAGRWRGKEKTECGIHFSNGNTVRGDVKEHAV
ncbi:phosphoadenylyl-sulfate reductase [Rhodobacteraceae bacterium]|nr:phosphoadenylyl-sulfate reductase [Paracoccaceae bacterium]